MGAKILQLFCSLPRFLQLPLLQNVHFASQCADVSRKKLQRRVQLIFRCSLRVRQGRDPASKLVDHVIGLVQLGIQRRERIGRQAFTVLFPVVEKSQQLSLSVASYSLRNDWLETCRNYPATNVLTKRAFRRRLCSLSDCKTEISFTKLQDQGLDCNWGT